MGVHRDPVLYNQNTKYYYADYSTEVYMNHSASDYCRNDTNGIRPVEASDIALLPQSLLDQSPYVGE